MGRHTNDIVLLGKLDSFAIELLAEAKEFEDKRDKISAFKECARWIAIKNRLEGGEGEGLDELKSHFATGTARTGNDRRHGPNFESEAQRDRKRASSIVETERKRTNLLLKAYDEGTGSGLGEFRKLVAGGRRGGNDGGVPGDRHDPGSAVAFDDGAPGGDGNGLEGNGDR